MLPTRRPSDSVADHAYPSIPRSVDTVRPKVCLATNGVGREKRSTTLAALRREVPSGGAATLGRGGPVHLILPASGAPGCGQIVNCGPASNFGWVAFPGYLLSLSRRGKSPGCLLLLA